ncbi:MAG: magnesium transporter [Desulfobacterales bacterium]
MIKSIMLKELLGPEIEEAIRGKNYNSLKEAISHWEPTEVTDLLLSLPEGDQPILFRLLRRQKAADVFSILHTEQQQQLLKNLTNDHIRTLLDELDPDDRTKLFEELPAQITQQLMNLLSPEDLKEARKLLGYPEDSIGRLMTPDFVSIRPEWEIGHALDYIRKHGRDAETVNVIYVVDNSGKLVDDLRLRTLILAPPDKTVDSVMDQHFVALSAYDDQEVAARAMQDYDRVALPVTDSEGILLGIVTVDDILDVIEEEATEDMHKIGGLEAIDTPYLSTPLLMLVKKRARWLVLLFLGEMLTAAAMGYFEKEIARAVVLALFVPLIISSGGNSGSQAATLIIRAMAVGEINLKDWWRVMRREIFSGLSLGAILGTIGFLRIAIWQKIFYLYGEHWMLVALTVASALVGVVMWGTLSGSMLPFILKRLGADPAASSAPFVATLVDVTGLMIYFTVAGLILSGTLL